MPTSAGKSFSQIENCSGDEYGAPMYTQNDAKMNVEELHSFSTKGVNIA